MTATSPLRSWIAAELKDLMEKFFYLGATLALTVFAQIVMKARSVAHAQQGAESRIVYLVAMYTDLRVLFVLACAIAASVSWSLALQRLPLTIAYPFMALTFVFVPIGSVLFLRESLSWMQLFASILIIIGVALSATAS